MEKKGMKSNTNTLKGGDKGNDLPNEKNKTRGKKNWQSMGFKTYLEYRQHLANDKERDDE